MKLSKTLQTLNKTWRWRKEEELRNRFIFSANTWGPGAITCCEDRRFRNVLWMIHDLKCVLKNSKSVVKWCLVTLMGYRKNPPTSFSWPRWNFRKISHLRQREIPHILVQQSRSVCFRTNLSLLFAIQHYTFCSTQIKYFKKIIWLRTLAKDVNTQLRNSSMITIDNQLRT